MDYLLQEEHFSVRKAEVSDAALIAELIQALAEYEKAPDQCFATREKIEKTIFSEKSARALIAEYDDAMAHMDLRAPVALLNEALIYPANDLGLNVACRIDRESATELAGTEWTDALSAMQAVGAQIALIEKQAPDALIRKLNAEGICTVQLDILSTGREDMGSDGYFEAMSGNLDALRKCFSENK